MPRGLAQQRTPPKTNIFWWKTTGDENGFYDLEGKSGDFN